MKLLSKNSSACSPYARRLRADITSSRIKIKLHNFQGNIQLGQCCIKLDLIQQPKIWKTKPVKRPVELGWWVLYARLEAGYRSPTGALLHSVCLRWSDCSPESVITPTDSSSIAGMCNHRPNPLATRPRLPFNITGQLIDCQCSKHIKNKLHVISEYVGITYTSHEYKRWNRFLWWWDQRR